MISKEKRVCRKIVNGHLRGLRIWNFFTLGPKEAWNRAIDNHSFVERVLILLIELIERTESEGKILIVRVWMMVCRGISSQSRVRSCEGWLGHRVKSVINLSLELLDEIERRRDLRKIVNKADRRLRTNVDIFYFHWVWRTKLSHVTQSIMTQVIEITFYTSCVMRYRSDLVHRLFSLNKTLSHARTTTNDCLNWISRSSDLFNARRWKRSSEWAPLLTVLVLINGKLVITRFFSNVRESFGGVIDLNLIGITYLLR